MSESMADAMKGIEKRRDEGNLRAYYYGFQSTGDPDIDLILAAVAAAGKGYHNTDGWTDDDNGPSYVEKIQEAADRAAAARQGRGWMATPQIIDDDEGTVRAETPTSIVRSWSYTNRDEQRQKMLMAREFAEGWFQAEKAHNVKRRDLSEFEGR